MQTLLTRHSGLIAEKILVAEYSFTSQSECRNFLNTLEKHICNFQRNKNKSK